MGSLAESRQAMASNMERLHSSSSERRHSFLPSRESNALAEPPTLNTMSYNPFTDNPHAATGNYSLVLEGTINPNRPVSSMLPPLERQSLMKTAGERAIKREKREVVRKFGNKPSYAQGTRSWAVTLQSATAEREQRDRELMYGHGKHIWAEMQRQKKKSKAPEDNRGELTRSTTSKRAAKINVTKKKLLKKAADKSKMEQGVFWTKNNAYMFEDIMNDVLPMPRPVSPGEIMVYNSPRPSVLDSDEEDEEERRLCNNLMALPPTELPNNRLSEAHLMHTFDSASLFTSTRTMTAMTLTKSQMIGGPYNRADDSRANSSYDGVGRKIHSSQSSRTGSPTRQPLPKATDLPPTSSLQLFRPARVMTPASRVPGTAHDMRVTVPSKTVHEDKKDRFSAIPTNLPNTGNWEVMWANPNAERRTNMKTVKLDPMGEHPSFPAAPRPGSVRSSRPGTADYESQKLMETIKSEDVVYAVHEQWDNPSCQTGVRNGRGKRSERWHEVADELDEKPTTMDDVGPYYTFGELGRLERRYQQQAAKNPEDLNLNHSLFGKNQVATLTELLMRHPVIKNLQLSNNALDDAMTALLIETIASGQTGINKLTLDDNELTWLTCERLAMLLHYGTSSKPPSAVAGPRSVIRTQPPVECLRMLNISQNNIGVKGIKLLCRTLGEEKCLLHTLDVTNCGITESGAAAIGEMLEYNMDLRILKMGWNKINAKGAMQLRGGLRLGNLTEFHVPRCGLTDTGGAFIANAILGSSTLKKVDMSANNLSGGTCSVLSEAIKGKDGTGTDISVTYLNLKDNPLGLVGCRKMLQGMVENKTLETVLLSGCSFLKYNRGNGDFNPNNPNGSYSLSLKDPVDCQVALELSRLRDKQGITSWSNVKMDGKEIGAAVFGRWPNQEPFPEEGILDVAFQWIKKPASHEDRALDDREFQVMWENICGPLEDSTYEKGSAEFLEKEAITDEWRLSLLNTLVIDCFFTSQQAQQVVKSFDYKETMVEAGLQVYGRIMDPQNAHKLMKQVLDKVQLKDLYTRLGSLAIFNPRNPTGYYRLQLSQQTQFTVARRLLEMFQTEVDERHNDFPLRTTWNEAFINGEPVPPELIQAPHLIALESTGSLSVSYVQHRPIKKGVKPVSNASYSVLINLLKDLDEIEDPQTVIAMVDNPATEVLVKVLRQFDGCPKTIQMSPEALRDLNLKVRNEQVATQIFRAFSVDHFITAAQLIGLLSMVTSPTVRIETVTAFWARITDRAKNFSDVMRYMNVEESTVLGKRIGYYAMLDQNKPSMYYRLRMYNKSEFRVAKILFQMAINKVLQTTSTHVYMKDLKVDNDPKHVLEGPNMWQVLTGNAPDGTDPTTTLDFYFDYPDVKAQTAAANLIKRRWQARQQARSFAVMRESIFRRSGGAEAFPTKYPKAKPPVRKESKS